jgi:hypothetical protein
MPLKLFLYDLSGKMLDAINTNYTLVGEYNIDVNMAKYEPGMYYISDEDGVNYLRFLINR